MTKKQELRQVERLAKQLPDIELDILEGYAGGIAGDFDWSYYHWNEIDHAFSDTIGDYQVHREMVLLAEESYIWHDKEANEFEGSWNSYQDFLSEHPEENDREDVEGYFKTTSEGDYLQYWYNVKTGSLIVRERKGIHNGKEHFDVEGKWTSRFITMDEIEPQTHYYADINIHKDLQDKGYEGYQENDFADDEPQYITIWHELLTNPYTATLFRYGGMDMYMASKDVHGAEIIAAVKIANRHHYMPDNKAMYLDYLRELAILGKDLHNPFYVCPADLTEAHNKWHKKYMDVLAKRELEKKMKEIITRNNDYLPRIAPFLSLAWHTDQYAVFVCPSVEDMVEEGVKMHHCVGSMGYDKKPDSLILFCRTPNGERISTIEYSISQGKVLQNRAACNKVPLYMDEVNKMLEADADKIRKCKLINIKNTTPVRMAA